VTPETPGFPAVWLTFAPDGHRSVFRRDWLAAQGGADPDPRTEDGKALWRARRPGTCGRRTTGGCSTSASSRTRTTCLRDARSHGAVAGGDTGLVDGFAAVAALRAADPESFGVLTGTPVPFGYIDKRPN
jgi:Taurine catabolism dioxygenase TauD, TfdA family